MGRGCWTEGEGLFIGYRRCTEQEAPVVLPWLTREAEKAQGRNNGIVDVV